jgi:hypothetical protein
MMRKPNYSMERKDRQRAKEAKATAKAENRAVKRDDSRESDVPTTDHHGASGERERQKSDN